MRKLFLLVTCSLLSLAVSSQTANDYLTKAKIKLREGNCESAQKFYNVYKQLSNKTDASVETQIRKCNGGVSTRNGDHKNYTETAFGINMKMIWVEGGSFMMGCTCQQNEHNVTLDGFFIGMLEVTQSQWEKVMGTSITQLHEKYSGSTNEVAKMSGVGDDYPMYFVSYPEALEFCRQLSIKTGKTYALPTEAQWEYAARGGKKNEGTKYSGSDKFSEVAWCKDNSGGVSHICGTKHANSLGIYDMSGNVLEWCSDWYYDSYLNYDTINPKGPSSGTKRCARGGCWTSESAFASVHIRWQASVEAAMNVLGFRVVCIP